MTLNVLDQLAIAQIVLDFAVLSTVFADNSGLKLLSLGGYPQSVCGGGKNDTLGYSRSMMSPSLSIRGTSDSLTLKADTPSSAMLFLRYMVCRDLPLSAILASARLASYTLHKTQLWSFG